MKNIIFVVLMVPFVFGLKKPTCEEYIKNSPQCVGCNADGNKIYLYSQEETKNYLEAEKFCIENHGHLFTPTDRNELVAILTTSLMDKYPNDGTQILTAYIDIDESGMPISPCGIQAMDGPVPTTSAGMRCLTVSTNSGSPGGTAADCEEENQFICEIDYFQGSKFFIPTSLRNTSDFIVNTGNEEIDALITNNEETFEAAKERCEGNKFNATGTTNPPNDKMGNNVGNLVTIDSFQKNNFISNLLKSRGLTNQNDTKLWTGLSYDQNCGKYSWCDNSKTFYRKWCTNHPKVDISNTTVLPPLNNMVQYCVADVEDDTTGCLQTYDNKDDDGNEIPEEEQKLLYICEKKATCDDGLKDFMKVIGQQVGFLRRQCKSCNAHRS